MYKSIEVIETESLTIVKCEDWGYEQHKGKYFVFDRNCGYGYFKHSTMKKGEILDKYNLVVNF